MAFNEDQNELSVLRQTPICFIIVGKPGCGKSSLARRLSAVWKCQLIDGTSNIEHIIKDNSQLAQQVKKTLIDGGEISEEQVASIILDKLNSPEIQHYGSILHTTRSCTRVYDDI
jgi:adenylate/nucleoside-diphosphate kinase